MKRSFLVAAVAVPLLMIAGCGGGLNADAEQAYKLIKEQGDYCQMWAKMVADGVHQDDYGASWWAMNDSRIDAIAEVDVVEGGKKAVAECE